jgi:salicylate 5-hydroxylase small subunit
MSAQDDVQTYLALAQLYADYAAAVDAADWDRWVEFFVDDCEYKVQPRENFERGFPLSTLALLSKGMLRDRVYGIRETLFHDPYYQRHTVGLPRILRREGDLVEAEANYAVFLTKLSQETTVFNVCR